MVLYGMKDDGDWIVSGWRLTYKVGWEHILNMALSAYDYYSGMEVLADKERVTIFKKEDILKIEEASSLTFRGLLNVVKAPVAITLRNQTDLVDVCVAKATDEFKDADYISFNISMGQYLDSLELAMHMKTR